jgi:hypothetical protein
MDHPQTWLVQLIMTLQVTANKNHVYHFLSVEINMLRVLENRMMKWEICFVLSLVNFIILQDMVFVVSLCVPF